MKAGTVLSPGDREGIKRSLYSYFEEFSRGKFTADYDLEEVKRYERKSITAMLSSLFDEVASRS